jgi:hypothetical protein
MASGAGFRRTKRHFRVRLYPEKIRLQSKVEVVMTETPENFSYRVGVYAPRDSYGDLDIIKEAIIEYGQNNYAGAIASLKEYFAYSETNPNINLFMAQICQVTEDIPTAREYALRAATCGLADQGLDLYRALVEGNWASDADHLAELRKSSQAWDLDKNHGVAVLEINKYHLLEIGSWYLKTIREIHEIRRPVAARMLSRVEFDFSDRDYLLYTACRIIHPDGTTRDLPLERLAVGDSQQRIISITTESERTASWLLPDLSTGDLIEWCYHTLINESYTDKDDTLHRLIIADLAHPFHPTLSGTVVFESSKGKPLYTGQKNFNDDQAIEASQEKENTVSKYEISNYIPVANTNQYFENYFHNPIVGCTLTRSSWPDVAGAVLRHNFGDLTAEDTLPAPLSEYVDTCASPIEGLKKSFYWVRDKLKYASVGSAIELIGTAERTQAIVASGSADCKDKSYVLYQVCRKLGLPAHIVAVSSKHGLVFEKLPSDQFDHVFVKVDIDGRRYYLDGANRHSVFGSCPPLYQGLQTLVLNDGGTLDTLTPDIPEINHVTITETFDSISGGRLHGSFHIVAEGNIGRLVDENLKAQSLNSADYLQSAQVILRHFLPSMLLESFDRMSHTAYSDRFEAVGMQRRCQLSKSGSKMVGMLEWNDPTLPLGIWKSYRTDKTFVFYQPTIVDINVVLNGDLVNLLSDISDPFMLTNDICTIRADTIKNDDELILKRSVTIQRKYVDPGELDKVPESMDTIEQLFQASLIFEK